MDSMLDLTDPTCPHPEKCALLLHEIQWKPLRSGRIRQPERPGICSRALLITGFFLLAIGRLKAQQGADYVVHANIIYHFTKYIDWPDDKKSGDFVIGIVGETPLYDALKTFMVNKMAGNQKIVIKKIPRSGSPFNCHILFVSEEASSSLKKIAAATGGSDILLVSEMEGLARKGSCINFIIVDDRLKLEINKTNIERRNLSIASELLKLGIPVK